MGSIRFIQQVTGTILFYARAIDPMMLVALSAIASEQSKPTEAMMEKTRQFLDYVVTHPDATLTYRASNMVLNMHSDTSYLIEPKARSKAGGHFSCRTTVLTHAIMARSTTQPKSSNG